MLQILLSLALIASSDAIITRWAPCCFGISASGAVTGTLGQLDDGQNRVNGPLSPAEYCISDSSITDASGRGCILTPPTSQFQCDTGATPTSGFSIGCDGTIAYNGGTTFWECQTGDNGEANVYLTPGGSNCGEITLKANGCFSGCPPPPPPPPPPPVGCPTNLNGAFEFPHLIIPIDSSNPSLAPGTSYFGEISSTISSIFNFDIPAADSGKTCSLVFLFPTQAELVTSSFTGTGGPIDFALLSGVATRATSYANAPAVSKDYGVTNVAPGNSYSIATFPCPGGSAISIELKSAGTCGLKYFQDYNPSPIGLYITKC